MAATVKVVVPRDLQGKVGDKESRDGGNRYGKATGLRMTHFVDSLLRANEAAKETDEVLAATLAAEFPKRDVIQAPASYRGYFNQGLHGHNPGCKYHSASYNAEGEARRRSPAGKAKGGKGKGGKAKAKGGKGKASE